MSIFGSMKTAVSGMSAQANRLSTVSDNIANANTVGYKAVSTSFSSLVLPSSSGNYNSGGVQTSVRQAISEQGDISYTTSAYDLAISGDGFFIVAPRPPDRSAVPRPTSPTPPIVSPRARSSRPRCSKKPRPRSRR